MYFDPCENHFYFFFRSNIIYFHITATHTHLIKYQSSETVRSIGHVMLSPSPQVYLNWQSETLTDKWNKPHLSDVLTEQCGYLQGNRRFFNEQSIVIPSSTFYKTLYYIINMTFSPLYLAHFCNLPLFNEYILKLMLSINVCQIWCQFGHSSYKSVHKVAPFKLKLTLKPDLCKINVGTGVRTGNSAV